VWGTIGPVVDVVVRRSELSVWTAGAYRAGWALLALVALVLALRRTAACRVVVRDASARTVAVGALTGAFQVLFFVSVAAGGVTVATVVALGVAPLAPMLLRAAVARRPPPRGDVTAVACAVAGLLLVSFGGGATDPAHPLLGVVAAVGSGVAFGLSAEVAGPLTQRFDPLAVAALSTGVAAVVVLLCGLAVAVPRGLPLGPGGPVSVLLVAYLGVGTMALAYVLFFAGLRTTASGTAVLAALLEPVTAVVIAVLLLGERLTLASALGAVLIVATIASLGRRPAVAPH